MNGKHQVQHEASAAAYVERNRATGELILKGKLSTPAIYSTVPPPRRELPTRMMERYNVDKGVWVKAEPALQKYDLAAMVRMARAMPGVLRVVVLNHLGSRVVLAEDAVVKGDLKPGQSLRITKRGKVQRVLPQRAAVEKPKAKCKVAPKRKAAPTKPKAKQPPRPRRAPAKPRPVPAIPPAPVLVPMVQPMQLRDRVQEELAYAMKRGMRLGNMAEAFARAALA